MASATSPVHEGRSGKKTKSYAGKESSWHHFCFWCILFLVGGYLYIDQPTTDSYILDIVPGTSGLDLSTVSAATLHVERADGTTTTWSTTLSNQTATTLRLTHTIGASDLTKIGPYKAKAYMTTPGGTRISDVDEFTVRGKYQARA